MPSILLITGLQGADQHFAVEQSGEASEDLVEQLCKEVLTFAHHLVELGPVPAPAPLENGTLTGHGKLSLSS